MFWAVAVLVGAVDAVVLKGFELVVNDGTPYLWNDVFHTDTHRWGVVPLAVGLGVGLSLLFRATRVERVVPPKTDPFDESGPPPPDTLGGIGVLLAIGLGSLVAGASLGPEASLVAFATSLGLWAAHRAGTSHEAAELLALASVGALLVAFLGSVVPVLIPLLLLGKKRHLTATTAVPVLLAGASSFGTLWLMDHSVAGWGSVPVGPGFTLLDALLALLVGVCAAGLGRSLKRGIHGLGALARRLDAAVPWWVSAALFGLVVGALYWLGGESVQFSGSGGTPMVLHQTPAYGFWTLALLLVVKLAATAWSLATGYRGGLVFPSVYVGAVVFLMAQALFPAAGPGVLVGSVAGVFGALTGTVPGLVLIVAVVPLPALPLAVLGAAGAALGNGLITRATRRPAVGVPEE